MTKGRLSIQFEHFSLFADSGRLNCEIRAQNVPLETSNAVLTKIVINFLPIIGKFSVQSPNKNLTF